MQTFSLTPNQRELLSIGVTPGDYGELRGAIPGAFSREEVTSAWQQLAADAEILRAGLLDDGSYTEPVWFTEGDPAVLIWSTEAEEVLSKDRPSVRMEVTQDEKGLQFRLRFPLLLLDRYTAASLVDRYQALLAGKQVLPTPIPYASFGQWREQVIEEQSDPEATKFWEGKSTDMCAISEIWLSRSVEVSEKRAQHRHRFADADFTEAQCLAAWLRTLARITGKADANSLVRLDGRLFQEFEAIEGVVAQTVPFTVEKIGFGSIVKPETVEGVLEKHRHLAFSWAELHFDTFTDSPLFEFMGLGERAWSFSGFSGDLPSPLACSIFATEGAAEIVLSSQGRFDEAALSAISSILSAEMGLPDDFQTPPSEPESDAHASDPTTLVALMQARWMEYADRLFAVENAEEWTFAQAKRHVDALSTEIARRVEGKGRPVAIHMQRSAWWPVAMHAIWQAGHVVVPVDVELPATRKQDMLGDLAPALVLCDYVFETAWPQLEVSKDSTTASVVPEAVFPAPGDTAYVLYTSGTSGKPKGVSIPHGAIAHYIRWAAGRYPSAGAPDAVFFTNPCFDLTMTSMFAASLVGGCIRVAQADDAENTLSEVLFGEGALGFVKLTPTHVRLINPSETRRSSVHTFVLGGEAVRLEDLALLRKVAPGARIFNEYGPTEATVGCMIYEYPDQVTDPNTIGHAIPGWEVHIAAADGQEAMPGEAGEMYIAGAGLADGYLGDASLTDQLFVTAEDGKRWYRSRDLAFCDAMGRIHYLGRTDSQVKRHGRRIELDDIATHVQNCAGVSWAAVRLLEDGERSWLVAYFTAAEPVSESALRSHVARHLPDWMIPDLFERVPRVPYNRNGKVDLAQLPEIGQILISRQTPVDQPVGEMETLLAEVFAEVLKSARCGRQSHFLEQGGDSIKAIQLSGRLRAKGITLKVRDILLHPVLKEMATFMHRSADPVPASPDSHDYPLPPHMRRLVLRNPETAHHYNHSIVLKLSEGIDAERLRNALGELWKRHDAWRICRGEEHRLAESSAPIGWSVFDGGIEDFSRVLEPELQGGFDLDRGPLVHAVHVRDSSESYLFLVMHHWVSDGISMQTILQDLDAALGGSPLPETTPHAVWARHIGSVYADEDFADEDHWHDLISGIDAVWPHKSFVEHHTRFAVERVPAVADLLHAAAKAVPDFSGKQIFFVETHGREPHRFSADVARSVGWFSQTVPLSIHANDSVTDVAASLDRIPDGGLGYDAWLLKNGRHSNAGSLTLNLMGKIPSGFRHFSLIPQYSTGNIHPDFMHETPLHLAVATFGNEVDVVLSVSNESPYFEHRDAILAQLVSSFTVSADMLPAHVMESNTGMEG